MKAIIPQSQDDIIRSMYLSGISAERIARQLGLRYKQPVLVSLKRTSTERRKYSKRSIRRLPRRLIKGYWHLYLPFHQNSRKDGYIAEHRLMAEQMLGRPLLATETVHHKDRNKQNNSPDNLEVFLSQAEHMEFHARIGFTRNNKGQWMSH